MKPTNIIQRFSLLLFALVFAASAWAQGNEMSIGSKEDWQTFCQRVENGETSLNAKLTDDVDLGTDIVMLGTYEKKYSGTFDGQGHTLKINWDGGTMSDMAPFRYVGSAKLMNLRTEGQLTSSGRCLAGLVMDIYGTTTLTSCISDVDITSSNDGDANSSSMIQYVGRGANATLTDCIVTGTFNATTDRCMRRIAGFVYTQLGTCTLNNCLYLGENNADTGSITWSITFAHRATLNNCYYLNPCGEAQGTQVTTEQLASGEVTKLLQAGRTDLMWGQTLATDTLPQLIAFAPTAEKVYQVKFTYNDEVKVSRYANNGQTVILPTVQDILGEAYNPHHYYSGFSFADNFTGRTPVTEDKTVAVSITDNEYFPISTKNEWQEFCILVNSGQTGVDAKLTADIDLGTDIVMLGNSSNLYGGTFDGQGHTLTINWEDAGHRVSPIRSIRGATIQNLRTHGRITSNTGRCLAGLVNEAFGNNTISNCVSDVDITASNSWFDSESAGLLQWIDHHATVTISDCVVKGSITDNAYEGWRGMAGFVYDKWGGLTMTNCLYLGTNNADSNNSCTLVNGNPTLTDCYYLNTCGNVQGTQVTAEQLASGEVAKLLQAGRTDACYWAQVLGDMPDPYREADKAKANYVYYNKVNNDWACENFVLTDGTAMPVGIDFTATNVSYDRTFAADKATLCLPYELTISGFKAYTLSGGGSSKVYFKEATGTLEAYKPYYITVDGTPQFSGTNLQVRAYNADNMTTPAGGYEFHGTAAAMDNAAATAANAYILQSDGAFHRVTAANNAAMIPPFRAYITCPPTASSAKQLSIVLDGETTDIDGVTDDAADISAAVYDLQGRRVADSLDDAARHQLPAGVYIVGGRKVIVK